MFVSYALGVDIGGTKIAAVILDRHGRILNRTEIASKAHNQEEMFNQVATCIDLVMKRSPICFADIQGMGVGVPGKVDAERGIAIYQNNIAWRNFPIVDRLKERFPINKIIVDNDVYMACYAEWKLSNIDENDTMVYLTVSTGISCSTIHKSSFVRGSGFAGEVGLFPVTTALLERGIECLEKVASGPAIERFAKEHLHHSKLTTKAFFQEYYAGNPKAQWIIAEIVKSLAYGIYSIICLLDPREIVLGGGVLNKNLILVELIKEALKQHLIPEQYHALEALRSSRLKGESGIVGAGMRVFDLQFK